MDRWILTITPIAALGLKAHVLGRESLEYAFSKIKNINGIKRLEVPCY